MACGKLATGSLLAALVLAFGFPRSSEAATPRDSRAFVDTIGVNLHLYYVDTAYGDFAMVKRRLQELGVRHVRDGFDPSRRQRFFDRVNALGAMGIESTLLACGIAPGGWINLDENVSDAKNRVRSSLEALEGANERARSPTSSSTSSPIRSAMSARRTSVCSRATGATSHPQGPSRT